VVWCISIPSWYGIYDVLIKKERIMSSYHHKETDEDGIIRYYNASNQLHRLDGPAIECANGDKHWYQNDQSHRLDGPAIEYANGDKCWYLNDQRHRLDGPAIECASGDKCWYQNGLWCGNPPTNYNNTYQLGDFVYSDNQLSTIFSVHSAGYAIRVVEFATRKAYWTFGWLVDKFVPKKKED